MAAHAAGEVRAAIVRASDFFGPGVERAILGLGAFRNVMAGKPVSCLGQPQLLHTLTYIEDFARAMVNVSETPECLGEVWHAPSAAARSLQGMVELIARECNTAPGLRPAPHWLFRVMGVFVPAMRELGEVYYQYTQPWVMDSPSTSNALAMRPPPMSRPYAIPHTLWTHCARMPQRPRWEAPRHDPMEHAPAQEAREQSRCEPGMAAFLAASLLGRQALADALTQRLTHFLWQRGGTCRAHTLVRSFRTRATTATRCCLLASGRLVRSATRAP